MSLPRLLSPDMLAIAFHFRPLNVRLVFQAVRGITLHVVYFYLFIEVRSIKSKHRNDILQSFG